MPNVCLLHNSRKLDDARKLMRLHPGIEDVKAMCEKENPDVLVRLKLILSVQLACSFFIS